MCSMNLLVFIVQDPAVCVSPLESLHVEFIHVDTDLNPILKLLTSYMGHPSYTLLSETFRNQIFSMPRPPLCRTTQQQQQVTERDWFEYARRTWVTLKKSDLLSEYQRLLHATRPS